MEQRKTLNVYTAEVDATRCTLKITSTETFWQGDGCEDVDRPGTFLEVVVSFERLKRDLFPIYPLEQLAESYKVVLHRQEKEITNEPEGYAKLYHDHVVKKIQQNPELYTQNMRRAVKEVL